MRRRPTLVPHRFRFQNNWEAKHSKTFIFQPTLGVKFAHNKNNSDGNEKFCNIWVGTVKQKLGTNGPRVRIPETQKTPEPLPDLSEAI